MDYFCDLWIGYITAIFIRKCTEIAIQRCPGCHSKLKSPILHQHHQYSLLDKLKLYFEEVRGLLLPSIDVIYKTVEANLPHSEDLCKDKEIYCRNGIFFLNNSNPDSLYWGRFIDESNDGFIDEFISVNLKKKNAKLTKVRSSDKYNIM